MEKISGIIPNSPRVSSVDLREAAPVRPGAPGFGRAEGVSSLREATIAMDTAKKAVGVQQEVVGWKSKDQQQAAIVKDLSDKFFGKNRQAAAPVTEPAMNEIQVAPAFQSSVSSTPAGFKTDEVGSLRAASVRPDEFFVDTMADESAPQLQQPQGLFPKGSFINYSV